MQDYYGCANTDMQGAVSIPDWRTVFMTTGRVADSNARGAAGCLINQQMIALQRLLKGCGVESTAAWDKTCSPLEANYEVERQAMVRRILRLSKAESP